MKTINRFLYGALALFVTALIGTACMDGLSEQYDMSDGVVKLIPFTVTASTPKDTKATVDYVQQQIFEDEDQLYIESVDGKLTGTLKIKSGGAAIAKFEGTLTYTGSGDEPDPNLVLNARLISKNDKIGDKTFVGGIASKMTDAVSQFSTLTGTSTYEKKRFALNQGTAFVDFTVTFDPAPDDDFYDAELTISGGEISLGTADITVLGGNARFALAFPAGTTLDRAKVTLCGKEFKFGGTGNTLEAAKIYKVEKTYNEDLSTPLTFLALSDGTTITIDNPLERPIKYQKNNEDRTETTSTSITIDVNASDVVQFWGNSSTYADFSTGLKFTNIRASKDCQVYGNVMSLIDENNFPGLKMFTDILALYGLLTEIDVSQIIDMEDFIPSPHLLNHPTRNIVLPATTLTMGCYSLMFAGTGLSRMPDLPATIAPEGCYTYTFLHCPFLRTPARISATTVERECCAWMFAYSGLTSTPELPATVLGQSCYDSMFEGCTDLTDASATFSAITAGEESCVHMFEGCTSLVNAPEILVQYVDDYCFYSMFEGCTSLTTAPAILPAEYLAENCYSDMFYGCSSLTSAPELPSESLAKECYWRMFEGCSSLTTAPNLPAETLTDGCYNSMFKDCTSLNYIKCLAKTGIADACYNWVENVAPTGTFVEAEGIDWPLNSINGIPPGWREIDPLTIPLTLEAIQDGIIEVRVPATRPSSYQPISYTLNGGSKIITAETGTTEIVVRAGDKVAFYGDNDVYCSNPREYDDISGNVSIIANKLAYIYGNVMSLVSSTNFATANTLTVEGAFSGLFCGYDNNYRGQPVLTPNLIVSHPNLKLLLPATNLSFACYASMFAGCTALDKAPELPATVTAPGCYYFMYFGCTSLTDVPDLKADVITEACYQHMFSSCTALVNAPAIITNAPLADGCYKEMFEGCTQLKKAPALPATTLAKSCYLGMFENCTSLVNAPALPATTLAKNCYYGMFQGCKSMLVAPELKATELAEWCYHDMFQGCTGLTAAPELPARTMASECYWGMFGDCTNLTTAPELPAETLAPSCYALMFEGCTNLALAPDLPATTLASGCYTAMFRDCNNLTSAPVLHAAALVSSCYSYMFQGCSSLEYIKCLAMDITSGATENWVKDVAINGTFVKSVGSDDWTFGDNGIPKLWTIQTTDAPVVHEITYHLSQCSLSDAPHYVADGHSLTTTIRMNTGYSIESVKVQMGTVDITSECYTSGSPTISIASVTDNVDITVVSYFSGYTITKNLTNVSSIDYVPIVDAGAPLNMGLKPYDGYVFSSVLVTMGGADITSDCYNSETNRIDIASVTGNVVITATAIQDPSTTYSVTYKLSGVKSSNSDKTVAQNASYYTSLSPDNPGATMSVTVTMGGNDVTKKYWNSDKNELYIGSVTGDIVITASVSAVYYVISSNLTNCSLGNSKTRFEEGSLYETDLVPKSSSYEITDVKVTMGGNDVTASYYNATTHHIRIPAVTGNVSIKATATWAGTGVEIAYQMSGGITSSNTAESVNPGDPYNTRLTASEYFLVDVWMNDKYLTGGNAQKDSDKGYYYYDISIASVTGPVRISAYYK